jgi:hypothetical protein
MKYLILCCSLVFVCCSECTPTYLTNEEKKWCEGYYVGQIIVFKSNFNHLDTFIVENKADFHTNENCNQLVGILKKHLMRVELIPKICHDTFYCKVELEIIKELQNENTLPFIRVFGFEYAANNEKIALLTKEITLSTTKKKYDSAYYFQQNSNIKIYGNGYVKAFYWDEQDGLIRYESSKNEVFELLKR